ncbi:alpha/beta fold hydrolase [Marinomonas algarum]|uniref:Alpha/beta fold hydrolase n=1 Tax=Marinomonas algarum TaxID=2883105 RepID=A0A9X1IMI1_9GAMM|nr:alpha/beta fold hydrolase [Marinomonas algarum]MCB5161955.1 alpha/beta fold hydrolase [Marinomonas algarum]
MPERIETEAFGDITQPAIFMVSGWAMPKEVMHAFALRLSQRFYVVVASLPGISLDKEWVSRTRIGPNYDIDALSEQLIEAAPKQAWWVGWSLGGMISVYVAARRSSQVKGVITLATSPSFVERVGYPHGMPLDSFEAFSSLIERTPEAGLKRFTLLQASGAEQEREIAKQLQAFLPTETLDSVGLMGGLRLLKSLDIRREWAILDCPNAHIHGRKDTLMSSSGKAQYIESNALSHDIELPHCAHAIFLEDQETCARHIESFIDVNHT